MDFTPEQIDAAGARLLSDARTVYEDLREISLRAAARLESREPLTDADLYDEDGLPA